jgi:hypothetical protein
MYDQVQLYSPQQPQIVYVPAQPYPAPQWYPPGPQGPQSPPGMQGPNATHSPRGPWPVPIAPQGPDPGSWVNRSHYYDNLGTATLRVAYNRTGNGNYEEHSLAMTSAERELEGLGEVIRDFGRQMTEATMRVRKQVQGDVKRGTVVKPLRTMTGLRSVAATDERLPVTIPKNPKTALELVHQLVTMLSSKLVPTIAYERQGSITYVLKMVDTYIRNIRSFFTGDVVEQEDDEAKQKDDEKAMGLAYSLQCVESALVGIPSILDQGDHHRDVTDKIRTRCNEIIARIETASESQEQRRASRRSDAFGFGQKKVQPSKSNERASVSGLGT